MYQVKTNIEKNRVYFELGSMGAGEGEKLYNEVKKATNQLKSGFTAVSDISNFSITEPNEGHWSEKIMRHIADAGLEKVARVTGSESSSREKIEKYGYKVITVKTVEDADTILDKI